MNNNNLKPLLPKSSMKYFDNAQADLDLYLKGISIRVCLENILHTVLIHIVKKERNIQNLDKWKDKGLKSKIDQFKDYFPHEVYNNLLEIKNYSDAAAHDTGHDTLTESKSIEIVNKLKTICEWTIISYLKQNGFNTNSWVPTILSTLPPQYRVNILEKYFNLLEKDASKINLHLEQVQNYNNIQVELMQQAMINNDINEVERISKMESKELEKIDVSNVSKDVEKVLLTVDKLAMAYLKNNDYEKSISFINTCFEENIINLQFRDEMIDKLTSLFRELKNLPIAKNLDDSKESLNEVSKAIKEDEKDLFLTIFTAILLEG